MISISITPDELSRRVMQPDHLEAALNAMRTDGFVILENVIDPDHLEILRQKMEEDVKSLLARDDAPFNWNTGNVQQDPPPYPPYLFRDVLVNDMVVAVTGALLGPGVKNSMYSGNTAMPSTERQPVHGDTVHLWKNLEVAHPTHSVVINVPVVSVSPENGSTEIWPGSHLDTTLSFQEDIKVPLEAQERRRKIAPPLQPTIPLGGVLIRDMRLWHAGMPNRTEQPRPMIAMNHTCGWFRTGSLKFPRGTESFFDDSELRTQVTFVDEIIDHIQAPHGYEYSR